MRYLGIIFIAILLLISACSVQQVDEEEIVSEQIVTEPDETVSESIEELEPDTTKEVEKEEPEPVLLASKNLQLTHNEAGSCGLCYLGCLTMLLKYYEDSITLDDVFVYTGIGTEFSAAENTRANFAGFDSCGEGYCKQECDSDETINEQDDQCEEGYFCCVDIAGEEDEEEMPHFGEEDDELEESLGYNLIIQTAKNLGFMPKVSYTGTPKRVFMDFHENPSVEVQEQKSDKAALLNFTKLLISQDTPVMTWWDNGEVWENQFGIYMGIEPLVIKGYNEKSILINAATGTPTIENSAVDQDTFIEGWKGARTNPFVFYVEQKGNKKTTEEILLDLKTNAADAYSNMREYANNLEQGTASLGDGQPGSVSFKLRQYACLRESVAGFLVENGLNEIGSKYEESAAKFKQASELAEEYGSESKNEIAQLLNEISQIEEQAYTLWSQQ